MFTFYLCVPLNFEAFHDRLGPGLRDDDSYWEIWGNHIMAWNLVPWCRSLFEMATLSQCLHFLISTGRRRCRSLKVSCALETNINSTLHTTISKIGELLDNVTIFGNQLWKHWFSCLRWEQNKPLEQKKIVLKWTKTIVFELLKNVNGVRITSSIVKISFC